MSKRPADGDLDDANAKRLQSIFNKSAGQRRLLEQASALRIAAEARSPSAPLLITQSTASTPRSVTVPPASSSSVIEATLSASAAVAAEDDDDDVQVVNPVAVNAVPPPVDPEAISYMNQRLQEILAWSTTHNRNVFITGPAGSGKSWLIKAIRSNLEALGHKVEVIAPTGSAALNVEGKTCDSFFDLNPNTRKMRLSRVVKHGQSSTMRARLCNLKYLIIDEISMVSNEFFCQLEAIAREARGQATTFGGLRIIAVGDFAQLPPVKPQEHCLTCGTERLVRQKSRKHYCPVCEVEVDYDDQWAFRSPVWEKCRFRNILLDRILRQQDPEYKKIVRTLFLGNTLEQAQMDKLKERRELSGATTMHLFCKRRNVDDCNKQKYQDLRGPEMSYTAQDQYLPPPGIVYSGMYSIDTRDPGSNHLSFFREHAFPRVLRLKIGMPVILIANVDKEKGLVNGKRGRIVDWDYISPTDVPQFTGMASDRGPTWDRNDGLVEEDHVASLPKTQPHGRSHRIAAFLLTEENEGRPCPVVQFDDGPKVTILPELSKAEYAYGYAPGRYRGGDGDDEAEVQSGREANVAVFMRTQIPLLQAWAMTVHRSQGLTMSNYVANLRSPFCPGLEYVALTRATKFEALAVEGLGRRLMRSELPVREFLRKTFPELRSEMQPNEEPAAPRRRRA